MKKQKVLLKKLQLSKSKVARMDTHRVQGGIIYNLTDNGCSPEKSVWPDICPVSHNCPPASHTCPTVDCDSAFCASAFCDTTANPTLGCPTLAC